MAVIEVIEKADQRTGNEDDKGVRTYRRVFQVECDSKYDGPAVALSAGGIPRRFSPYIAGNDLDIKACCNGREARQADGKNGLFWEVLIGYSSAAEEHDSPFDRPWDIAFIKEDGEEPLDEAEDDANTPIVNKAGDRFDPPVTREKGFLGIEITRNVPDFDPVFAESYWYTTNDANLLGFSPECVLLTEWTASSASEEVDDVEIDYFVEHIVIMFDRRKWRSRPLNCGFRQKVGGERKDILVDGRAITSPANLDNAGALLPPDGNPVFLNFQKYPKKDFSPLGLE